MVAEMIPIPIRPEKADTAELRWMANEAALGRRIETRFPDRRSHGAIATWSTSAPPKAHHGAVPFPSAAMTAADTRKRRRL